MDFIALDKENLELKNVTKFIMDVSIIHHITYKLKNLDVKFIYIEGMDTTANECIIKENPDDNPFDIIILSAVRGGKVMIIKLIVNLI